MEGPARRPGSPSFGIRPDVPRLITLRDDPSPLRGCVAIGRDLTQGLRPGLLSDAPSGAVGRPAGSAPPRHGHPGRAFGPAARYGTARGRARLAGRPCRGGLRERPLYRGGSTVGRSIENRKSEIRNQVTVSPCRGGSNGRGVPMAVSPFRRVAVSTCRRSALTLVEIMVVVTIIVLLLAILLPAISKLRDKAKTDTARAQMQMIAMAIDEYARFWPPSRGQEFVGQCVSTRGLPPWSFADLWNRVDFGPPNYLYRLANIDHLRWSNQCLAYCLTAKVGTGPYLKKASIGSVEIGYRIRPVGALVAYIPLNTGDVNTYYPANPPLAQPVQRVMLFDPWGTPYFYSWVNAERMWLVQDNFDRLDAMGRHDRDNYGHLLNQAKDIAIISAGPDMKFYFLYPDGTLKVDATGPDGLFGTQDDLIEDDIVLGR